jgi:uncharacterized HAD superfamily protein
MLSPSKIAFDIDGVVADTMTLFLDIAKNEFGLNNIKYRDFIDYNLDCLDISVEILEGIIKKIEDGTYKATLKPIDGAPAVLKRIGEISESLLFVTARPKIGPIADWMIENLEVDPLKIKIIATGSYTAKEAVLLQHDISCFVEDRLETCFTLKEAGIEPILFKQPWNRKKHPFIEVESWEKLDQIIKYLSLSG